MADCLRQRHRPLPGRAADGLLFSVFFKPLTVGFHASRAAVSLAFSLFNSIGALWIPGTGMLIDRFGAKRVILVSTLIFASGPVLGVVGRHGFVAALSPLLAAGHLHGQWPGPVPYGVVISHWFDRHRGLALALAMMGIGVGSIVVPILSQRLITAFGWRMAFAIFGGATLLVPLPIVAALLQNDPAERGLHPDGDETGRVDLKPQQELPGMTWHEIWHSHYLLDADLRLFAGGRGGPRSRPAHGRYLTDRGITPERAAIATSLVGAAVIVGRLGSGYLLDRLFAPHVAILLYGATAVGAAILCTRTVGNAAFVAAFLAGLGMGAEVESMGYMISRYFGLHSFGAAYGHAFRGIHAGWRSGRLDDGRRLRSLPFLLRPALCPVWGDGVGARSAEPPRALPLRARSGG